MAHESTTIRFWGGLRTIGGTIISIECSGTRLIFDFGRTFSQQQNFLGGSFALRKGRTVHDALRLGVLPAIDGIYSRDQLQGEKQLKAAEETDIQTEVYISHLHLDHTGAMDTIAGSIPVYMTPESLKLEQALERSGERLALSRRYDKLQPSVPHRIGNLTMTPIRLDHDIVGASALHIATPDGSILYTGDLRLHGFHPQRTEAFIDQAKRLGFQLLIMETTTLSDVEQQRSPLVASRALPQRLMTEQQLAERWKQLSGMTDGLIIFNVYNRNVERLRQIVDTARHTQRKAVFNPASACLLNAFYPDLPLAVFAAAPGAAASEGYAEQVSAAAINRAPGSYMLQCSFEDSLQLLDLNLDGARYLHAGGMPIGDYDPSYKQLLDFLALVGIEHVALNCSGHAAPQHLKWILDQLDPDLLIPLHGFHPERLMPARGRQFLPEYGRTYRLGELMARG
ncbi:MAG: MBL fold metallo-hydrolase [Sporolactobacillus sp.]